MRRIIQVLGVSGLTLLGACQVTPAPQPVPLPTPVPQPQPPIGTCDASRVQSAIGQQASPAVLEQVTLGSGAQSARVVRPGEAVTMDFNASRLTVSVDAGNRITQLACG